MNKTVKCSYTDQEFRQIIREELQIVLNRGPVTPIKEVSQAWLTLDQAAEFIMLAKDSVNNLVLVNKIPHHKSGKRILFKTSELSEWLMTGNDV